MRHSHRSLPGIRVWSIIQTKTHRRGLQGTQPASSLHFLRNFQAYSLVTRWKGCSLSPITTWALTSTFFSLKYCRKTPSVDRPSALLMTVIGASAPPTAFQLVILPV
jgi:hypothetical protein